MSIISCLGAFMVVFACFKIDQIMLSQDLQYDHHHCWSNASIGRILLSFNYIYCFTLSGSQGPGDYPICHRVKGKTHHVETDKQPYCT